MPIDIIDVEAWAEAAALSPVELDCVTAVQLKILDGNAKCRVRRRR